MPLRSSQLDRLFFLSIFLKNISKAQNLSPFYFYAWQWVSNNHRFYSKSVFLPRTLRTLLRYNWQVESAYIFRCLMWCLIPIYIVKWLGNTCVSWAPLPFITVGRTEVWAIFPLHSWAPPIGFLSTTKSPPFQCALPEVQHLFCGILGHSWLENIVYLSPTLRPHIPSAPVRWILSPLPNLPWPLLIHALFPLPSCWNSTPTARLPQMKTCSLLRCFFSCVYQKINSKWMKEIDVLHEIIRKSRSYFQFLLCGRENACFPVSPCSSSELHFKIL